MSETTSKVVARVLDAQRTVEGAGFVVRRPFPTVWLDHVDPFLLLDHMGPTNLAPGEARGAPDHPHRGFETVSYVLEGEMEHGDSVGNKGRLGAGDVQWMTAGSGVVHSEMPSLRMQREGGRMHGFQLWVNLPARDKMMPPRYQEIPASRIPVAEGDGGRVRARVIAGEALGARAVIDTRTPIMYLHFTLAPGARVSQPVPRGWNALAYAMSGAGRVADTEVREGQMALLGEAGDAVTLSVAAEAARPLDVLLIGGEPLREPVARQGPFVMNTREELVQAFDDFRRGKMGRIQ